MLREAAFWRITDLLAQSYSLHKQDHGLGARILLRSGFETLAMIIYLNHNIRAVLENKLNFHAFGRLTQRLISGSKNQPGESAVNVLTMLDKGDQQYPGLRDMYDRLSESAHPNFEGLVWGYSEIDHDEYETIFRNRWMELYGERHAAAINLCMMSFHHEYNDTWPSLMEKLENWIVENDNWLESTKTATP